MGLVQGEHSWLRQCSGIGRQVGKLTQQATTDPRPMVSCPYSKGWKPQKGLVLFPLATGRNVLERGWEQKELISLIQVLLRVQGQVAQLRLPETCMAEEGCNWSSGGLDVLLAPPQAAHKSSAHMA